MGHRRAAIIGFFWAMIILFSSSVWALEVTVGGEFRFRARQRTDFDLQAFNRNSAGGNLIGDGTILTPFDLVTFDAPVGAKTYGASASNLSFPIRAVGGQFIQLLPYNGTTMVYNLTTGQFQADPGGGFVFFNDGSAAEEHFGYASTGRLNALRAASIKHARELARPHADAGNNDQSYIYDRIRVSVDAKIAEGLRAYVMLENYSDWGLSNGGAPTFNLPQFGGGDGSASIYGDRASLNLRYAWVDFVVPKTPVHLKIGRQPFALGHGILLDTRTWGGDMAYAYAPLGNLVTLGAFYGKLLEFNRANNDDASFWGVHADFTINPTNKVSTFYRYIWQRTTRYNMLNDITAGNFGQPLAVTTASPNRNVQYESNQHGWGIAADGKIPLGPVGLFYAAEADILWGQYTNWTEPRRMKPYGYWDNTNARTPLLMQEDLYQVAWGYGVQLGVDLKWVKIDVAHSYGSGDRTRASDTTFFAWDGADGVAHHQWTTGRRVEAFDAWGGDNMYSPWYTDIFLGSVKSANFGGSGLGTNGFTRRWNYGAEFGDVIMVKPTLVVMPFANLTLDASYAVFWKASNTNSNGAGVGRTIDGEAGSIILWKSNANNREQPNKQKIKPFLGQEINGHITYFPYKNLMLKGWGGIFLPGDWFRVQQRRHNFDSFLGVFSADGHDTVGLKPAWALQLDVIITF